jgi:hypothetical protein
MSRSNLTEGAPELFAEPQAVDSVRFSSCGEAPRSLEELCDLSRVVSGGDVRPV